MNPSQPPPDVLEEADCSPRSPDAKCCLPFLSLGRGRGGGLVWTNPFCLGLVGGWAVLGVVAEWGGGGKTRALLLAPLNQVSNK